MSSLILLVVWMIFFFSSRRRHTRFKCDWSSDVCSSDLKMNQFLKDEGALVVLQYGYNGDGGTVFASSGGSRDVKDPVPPPMVAVTPEHYNRIVRLMQHNIPVKLEFDIQARFIDSPTDSFNVIGE